MRLTAGPGARCASSGNRGPTSYPVVISSIDAGFSGLFGSGEGRAFLNDVDDETHYPVRVAHIADKDEHVAAS